MAKNKKVAVFLAEGFEEVEALTVVDVLRRLDIHCDMVSIKEEYVKGAHNILVKADKVLDDDIKDYDLITLPGGMPGSTNLRDSQKVIEAVQYFNENNKYIAAICAAPIVLVKAGVIKGKNVTSYPGFEEELSEGNYISSENVVVDGKMITSRGPATALAFSYKIAEELGADVKDLKEGMMYNFLINN